MAPRRLAYLAVLVTLALGLTGCASSPGWNWAGALEGVNRGMEQVQERHRAESQELDRLNAQRQQEVFQQQLLHELHQINTNLMFPRY